MLKLGEILVSKKIITVSQLESAIKEQQKSGEFLGKVLIKLGFITEEMLLRALSEQFNVPYMSLKGVSVDSSVMKSVPAKFVWHYKFMPIKLSGNVLTIALSNPLDVWPSEDIKLHLGYDVEIVLSPEGDINDSIKRYYGIGAETIENLLDTAGKEEHRISADAITEQAADLEKLAEDASVIKLVNQLLSEAIKDRATDIHIEAYTEKVRVRYRIDGILYDMFVQEDIKYLYQSIVSRIKIIGGMDIVERRQPQDGRAKVRLADKEIDLRLSVLPTLHGEHIVIRILPTQNLFSIDKLGLSSEDYSKLQIIMKKPHGIVFLTGPTGSGKTTTLYSALMQLNTSELKIITIEDPVEYELVGITQIQVNPKINFTFANALRSTLRHDPDVMMVGEVRDVETAELAIRIALTGHLVFSTLHTNDAPSGIARLLDMGIESFLVASSVNAFIAQRLVRTICDECKIKDTEYALKNALPEKISMPVEIYRGKGCEACKFTGYKGRTAIYEILLIDDKVRDLILKKASASQIKKEALANGMKSLKIDGWEKIAKGITTPEEVMRVTELEE